MESQSSNTEFEIIGARQATVGIQKHNPGATERPRSPVARGSLRTAPRARRTRNRVTAQISTKCGDSQRSPAHLRKYNYM